MIIPVKFSKGVFYLPDESSYQKFYSKGFGQKEDSFFTLTMYEALYLYEKGKVKIRDSKSKVLSFDYFMNKKDFDKDAFLVFKDLKSKGYTLKSGLKYGFMFRIYDKGIRPGQDHSKFLLDVCSEKDTLKIRDFSAKQRVAHSTRKQGLLAIVDEDLGITYFQTFWNKL